MPAKKSRSVLYQVQPRVPFEASFPLSILDGLAPRVYNRYLYIWQTKDVDDGQSLEESRSSLVHRLRVALESLLQFPDPGVFALPELLGSVYKNKPDGRLTLKVTKSSSIPFLVSYRDDVDFGSLQPSSNFPGSSLDVAIFATGMKVPATRMPHRVSALQLTFIRGGFVICISKHHSVIDGNAHALFIKHWFSRARAIATGEEVPVPSGPECDEIHERCVLSSTRPVRPLEIEDWVVRPRMTPTIFGANALEVPFKSVMGYIPFIWFRPTGVILHFDRDAVKRLKSATEAHGSGRISTNDAIGALIWRCITRARMGPNFTGTRRSCFCTIADSRTRIEPKLPAGYFGNGIFTVPTYMPISELVAADPQNQGKTAAAIRQSLTTKSSNDYIRNILQQAGAQRRVTDFKHDVTVYSGHDVVLTSWERFFQSTDDLSVGNGVFRAMRLPAGDSFDGLIVILPSYGMRDMTGNESYRGGIEVMVDLNAAHLDKLVLDAELRQFVTSIH